MIRDRGWRCAAEARSESRRARRLDARRFSATRLPSSRAGAESGMLAVATFHEAPQPMTTVVHISDGKEHEDLGSVILDAGDV